MLGHLFKPTFCSCTQGRELHRWGCGLSPAIDWQEPKTLRLVLHACQLILALAVAHEDEGKRVRRSNLGVISRQRHLLPGLDGRLGPTFL